MDYIIVNVSKIYINDPCRCDSAIVLTDDQAPIATLKPPNNSSESCLLDLDSESSWPEHPPIVTDYDGALILPDGQRGNRTLNIRENQVELL